MARSLKNITVDEFRGYLIFKGLKHIRTSGSHEVWIRKDLLRPVIIQTGVTPVPVFIIRNNLRTIGEEAADHIMYLEGKE